MNWPSLLLSAVLVSSSLAACASVPPYPTTARDASERIVQARAVLARQRRSTFADEIMLDANRAEQWLDQANARLGRGPADADVDLLLTTAEGQLSVIETHFSRREAERRLMLVNQKTTLGGDP